MDDRLGLFGGRDKLDHLLERPGTVLIKSNLNELMSSVVDQVSPLFIVGIFEQFLAQVIAERIYVWC